MHLPHKFPRQVLRSGRIESAWMGIEEKCFDASRTLGLSCSSSLQKESSDAYCIPHLSLGHGDSVFLLLIFACSFTTTNGSEEEKNSLNYNTLVDIMMERNSKLPLPPSRGK